MYESVLNKGVEIKVSEFETVKGKKEQEDKKQNMIEINSNASDKERKLSENSNEEFVSVHNELSNIFKNNIKDSKSVEEK
jgi:hypothetical protein